MIDAVTEREPPIPASADLRQIGEMPVDVEAIRALAQNVSAEAFRAAVLLHCHAWHQVPPGSLPDDDVELCAMAGLERPVWETVRDRALEGFARCSDGRLYHPGIVAKAITMLAEVEKRERRKADDRRRQKLHYDRKTGKAPPKPNTETPSLVTATPSPVAPLGNPSHPCIEPPPSPSSEPAISCGDPVHNGKPHPLNGQAAPTTLAGHQHERAKTETQPAAVSRAQPAIPAGVEVGTPGYNWDPEQLTQSDWDRVVGKYALSGTWAHCLGPVPGYLGCKAPAEVLFRRGFDVRIESGGRVKTLSALRTGI
jgi:hypothetical protein